MPMVIPVLSKVKTITRDLSLATSSLAVTGIGFRPKSLSIAHVVPNTTAFGQMFVDETLGIAGMAFYGSGLTAGAARIYLADGTAGNYQAVTVASYDDDGFTFTFTKTGSPTGTATIHILARN